MIRPENAAALDSFFPARRFALMLALLIGACFSPVLFGFQSFVFRDFGLFGHPLAHHFRESFWRGEIPLWNPLNNCGLPFMAQWNTMVFYPPSLIYLLLPLPWSLNVFCLVHLWFGGIGMYFLARRWTDSNFAAAFAGLVFACNGLALHCLMWPNNIAALGWMPWVLLLVSRAWERGGRALLPAMLAGACQFMTGAPEAFLLTWVVAAILWLTAVESDRAQFLKMSFRFAAVVTGVIALCAVQWLPMLELLRQSQRTSDYDTGGWAMPAWGWANLLVPQFRTLMSSPGVPYQIGQSWTSSYYFGVITLLLAVTAVVRLRQTRVWALLVIVVLGLVFALGNAGFIWPLIKHYVGALGFIRYPVKFVFAVTVPLILLAAMGLAAWMRPAENSTPRAESESDVTVTGARTFYVVSAALLGAILIIVWFAGQYPLPNQDTEGAVRNGLLRGLFFAVLATGFWFLRKTSARRARWIAIVWLLTVAADFFTHLPWQNPTIVPAFLAPRVDGLEILRAGAAPGRSRIMPSIAAIRYFHQMSATNVGEGYLSHRLGQSQNVNLLEGVAKADGFYSLYLGQQQEVQYRIFPDENSVHPAVADVMGVGFMTAPGKLLEWSARTNSLPVVSAGQQPVFVAEGDMLGTILRSNFNPRANLLLPLEARASVTATRQPEAKVTVEKFGAHDILLKVTTPAATVVSVSQAFFRPWKAYVDDAPVSLWRANHAFQAVAVPAGEHHVRLRYEDQMFRIGAIISGVALALLLIGRVLIGRERAATAP